MEHGSIITQARREDALVLTKQGLVSKSSPKKPRGRNIFKALFCCFRAQHVGQSSSSTELAAYKEEANTIAKSDLLQCLQYQFYQVRDSGLVSTQKPGPCDPCQLHGQGDVHSPWCLASHLPDLRSHLFPIFVEGLLCARH